MSIFNLMTDEDKNLIERYIQTYSSESFDKTKFRGIETVLEPWAKAKNISLIKLMNNQLILRRPYSYEAQTEAIAQLLIDSIEFDKEPNDFFNWLHTIILHNKAQVKYQDGSTDNAASILRTCKRATTLAANQYNDMNAIITFPSGATMKVFKGMKPMKIFYRFVQEYEGPEEVFDAFRIWHSRQLNQKTMDGELCLSIHPLDYMTMSDNDNNWTSCMRWNDENADNPGDYRAGTLSCMNSPYILVAYLHNPKHPYEVPFINFSWNSKQWRELFIVQEGIITEIKGYPYQDSHLTNTCLMWIKELAEKNLGWTYNDEEINVGTEIKTTNRGPILFTFAPGGYMYNDMGTLDLHRGRYNLDCLFGKYNPDVMHKDGTLWKTFIDIPYGGYPSCMCCGKELDDTNSDSEDVLCEACSNETRCPHCGSRIHSGEDTYWIEEYEEPICLSCWEDDCAWDDFNYDTPHLIDSMTEISVLLGYHQGKPVWLDQRAFCYQPDTNDCYNDIFDSPPLEMITPLLYGKDERTYVTLDMIRPGKESEFCGVFGLSKKTDLSQLINDYI